MKDIEVPELVESAETVYDVLGVLCCGVLFLLYLDQESPEVIDSHDSIIGVLVEQALHLVRRFRHGQPETPAEAEADAVGLFGHWDRGIPDSVRM